MTHFTRRWVLVAGLCMGSACEEPEREPAAPWMPDSEQGTGALEAGAPPQLDGGQSAQPEGGMSPLDAGSAASDAAPPPAEAGHDAARADAATDGGPGDAGADAARDGSTAPLQDEILHATIVVAGGQVYDGAGKRFVAGPELGDGSQSETQKPLFKLEDGARLINVVLGSPAADGVHTHGDVSLENIVWQDIGEDALTIKESGTVVLDGGSARDGEDKVFQINAASVFRVSNFQARKAGKFIRQNGNTTYKVEVFIDRCDIADMDEAIFRTDSPSSTVSMTNTRYSGIGETLFKGVAPANITTSQNTAY